MRFEQLVGWVQQQQTNQNKYHANYIKLVLDARGKQIQQLEKHVTVTNDELQPTTSKARDQAVETLRNARYRTRGCE